MAKEYQRKKKLIQLIKDLALRETTIANRIPQSISDYILGEFGMRHSSDFKDIPCEEEMDFVVKLENFIKEKYESRKTTDIGNYVREVDQKHCFMKSCDALATARSEYLKITDRINSLLHEIIQLKEKYSEHSKEESSLKKGELEVLDKKLHCLKLQFFLKFYGENKALDAQLKLREILRERLTHLQSQYDNFVDLVAKYNELKNNKSYIDLLHIYKQLLKKEMKIDYMIEN